eukprot:1103217-Lingulodinium_polyedra.AAC.1
MRRIDGSPPQRFSNRMSADFMRAPENWRARTRAWSAGSWGSRAVVAGNRRFDGIIVECSADVAQ